MTDPAYTEDRITLYQADALEHPHLWAPTGTHSDEVVILDPPYDRPELYAAAAAHIPDNITIIALTDAGRFGPVIEALGSPWWVFTWDTLNTWTKSTRHPVQQTKHALVYGDHYDRDGTLWGDRPPTRDHPTTKQKPLDGRRLTDLWRESSRWLRNPTAGRPSGGHGAGRYEPRTAASHAKPVGWLRCLIGNTSPNGGTIIDPFAGTGTSLRAAKDLGRHAIGIELDPAMVDIIVDTLAQEVLPL